MHYGFRAALTAKLSARRECTAGISDPAGTALLWSRMSPHGLWVLAWWVLLGWWGAACVALQMPFACLVGYTPSPLWLQVTISLEICPK